MLNHRIKPLQNKMNISGCVLKVPKDEKQKPISYMAADRLAQLVECRTTVREVSGSSPRPDQHSGS